MFRSPHACGSVRSASAKGGCRQATHPRRRVSLQLECLEDRVVPAGPDLFNLLPASATITVSLGGQTVSLPVQITSPLGPVDTGTVAVELLVNGQPLTGATANVSNGQATVQLPVPGGLLSGTYSLLEQYLQGTTPLASAPGTLAVTGGSTGGVGGGGSGGGAGSGAGTAGQSQIQAAIEVAIDTAAILLQGNFAAEQELQIASVMFLQQPLSSNLVSDLLSHIGPAGGFAFPAIQAGVQFANSVQNPSS